MKKIFVTFLAAGLGFFASAQTLDLGLRGGMASTWLMNQNVYNAGSDQDVVMSWSPEFGFHSELNFIGGTGILLDVIYSKYTQNYKGSFQDAGALYQNIPNLSLSSMPDNFYVANETYTGSSQLTLIKFPLLFHYEAMGGFSLEVGPEYAMVNDANYSASYTGQPTVSIIGTTPPANVSYNTKSSWASSSMNVVLGFGWNIKLTPTGNIFLLADLRFEYGLSDLKGTDGLGEDLNNQSTNPVYAAHNFRNYTAYTPTHMLEGSLSVGVFYRINLLKGAKSLL